VAPAATSLAVGSSEVDGAAPSGSDGADPGTASGDDELGLDGDDELGLDGEDVGLDGGDGGDGGVGDGKDGASESVPNAETGPALNQAGNWATVTHVPPIPPRPPAALAAEPSRPQIVVAGTQIGLVSAQESKKRKRGNDTSKRKPRSCKRCAQFGGANGLVCRGSKPRGGGEDRCEYFDAQGGALGHK